MKEMKVEEYDSEQLDGLCAEREFLILETEQNLEVSDCNCIYCPTIGT